MVIHGQIEHGAIVLPGNVCLPEGAPVTVIVQASPALPATDRPRVQLPLIKSNHAGELKLTGESIAEIVDEDDLSS
jgi:hypothetical protein